MTAATGSHDEGTVTRRDRRLEHRPRGKAALVQGLLAIEKAFPKVETPLKTVEVPGGV